MEIDQYGQVQRTEKELIDIILQNPEINISDFFLSDNDSVEKFNTSAEKCDVNLTLSTKNIISDSIETFDRKNQEHWFIPEEYLNLDIANLLLSQIKTQKEEERIIKELEIFHEKNMIHILIIAKYLVDSFRKHDIVWGVGRGSSVASYCLYLIGLHKINSLQYDLDINEFLK